MVATYFLVLSKVVCNVERLSVRDDFTNCRVTLSFIIAANVLALGAVFFVLRLRQKKNGAKHMLAIRTSS
jgi:hypothetical protein